MTSTVGLVKRFHQLASDYDNRPVVVQRGTVRSIMRFVGHEEWEVRSTAAETLLLLAKHPDNKEPLCREKGLIEAIFAEYRDTEGKDPELHDTYAAIFDELRSVLETDAAADAGDDEGATPQNDGHSVRTVQNRPTRVRQGAKASRSLLLTVVNLTPTTHDELDHLLQTTRGVVSYTIDCPTKAVRVFGSVVTAALRTVLEDGGFEVEVVSDDVVAGDADADAGDENASSAASGLPSYRQSGAQGSSRLNIFGNVDWRRTIVLHGIEGNSLQARLDRQKEERERKHAASKGAMSSFLGKLKSWW
jgi:hypothetical protein